MTLDQIKKIVEDALGKHIAPARLTAVLVYEEEDADGDPILRIRAFVDSSGPGVGADRVFTATGVLRGALERAGETRFPLLTYPTSDELPEVAA
jgi:hypothetical protein